MSSPKRRGARVHRLAVLGPGRLVGEIALLDGRPRAATVRALEPAVLLELDDHHFSRLVDSGSPLALRLLEALNRSLIAALHRRDSEAIAVGSSVPERGPRRVAARGSSGEPTVPARTGCWGV